MKESIIGLSKEEFRRLTGVKRETFEKMKMLLEEDYKKKSSRGGRKSKVSVEEKLLMTLEYLREYRSYFHISKNYNISEGYVCKIIRNVEDVLIKSKLFHVGGRKTLTKDEAPLLVLIDASETPIERPKKKQKQYYSGKKKDIH